MRKNGEDKRRHTWTNHRCLAPYLQTDGPSPPMEQCQTPPEGPSHQSSTRITSFLVMDVWVFQQSRLLHTPSPHLLHAPGNVIPNLTPWQGP